MSAPAESCRSVHERESAFLDGRLAASDRRRMQHHLQACAACMQRLQQMARLSRATHNLPLHRVTGDLAHDVRRRVAARRQTTVAGLSAFPALRVWHLAAAAVLLLGLGWLAGYRSGRVMPGSTVDPGGDGVAAAVPAATWLDRVDPTFVAAGEELVRDLELAPALPERGRRPMIASELALFDLAPRARQVLDVAPVDSSEHRLARFVSELSESLHEREPDWQWWRDRAERDGLLTRLVVGRPQQLSAAVSVEVVVERHGGGLSTSERSQLAEFLALRQQQMAGRFDDSVALTERLESRTDGDGSFALASGIAGARSMAAAGLHESAERMFAAMRSQLEHAAGIDEPFANPAALLLEQMMRDLDRARSGGDR